MSRRIKGFAAAAGLVVVSAAALAEDRGGYYDGAPDAYGDYDYASVLRVDPLRRQVRVSEPVRECWQEPVHASQGPFSYNHVGGTLLGSTLGVVAGNQVGRGRGKDVARVAGALIGGAIGHHVSVDRQRQLDGGRERLVERCDVRYEDRYEDRIDGYQVTYEYAGREYVTRLPYDPGERLRVRVDVTPAAG
jgi:uncharacterized protein YcfJ